mmetsp:Transcript_324/g.816  ORF Transcript_324/g.816 Transcript_324/m.816 type:complete len:376 (+) Transcript_324:87-1214(+)
MFLSVFFGFLSLLLRNNDSSWPHKSRIELKLLLSKPMNNIILSMAEECCHPIRSCSPLCLCHDVCPSLQQNLPRFHLSIVSSPVHRCPVIVVGTIHIATFLDQKLDDFAMAVECRVMQSCQTILLFCIRQIGSTLDQTMHHPNRASFASFDKLFINVHLLIPLELLPVFIIQFQGKLASPPSMLILHVLDHSRSIVSSINRRLALGHHKRSPELIIAHPACCVEETMLACGVVVGRQMLPLLGCFVKVKNLKRLITLVGSILLPVSVLLQPILEPIPLPHWSLKRLVADTSQVLPFEPVLFSEVDSPVGLVSKKRVSPRLPLAKVRYVVGIRVRGVEYLSVEVGDTILECQLSASLPYLAFHKEGNIETAVTVAR